MSCVQAAAEASAESPSQEPFFSISETPLSALHITGIGTCTLYVSISLHLSLQRRTAQP